MSIKTKRSHLRETRSVNVEDLEMRDNTDGTITFSGYASVTGVAYRVADFLGEYDETIAAGAFTKALQENDDVRLLLNHEGVPLARTKSGTLTLIEDGIGLRAEAQLDPSSPLVQTIRSAMNRGDLDQMSFAFAVVQQSWTPDYSQRTITECRLFDVSVVTYPASPSTSADLRQSVMRSLAASVPSGRIDEIILELRDNQLSESNHTLLEDLLVGIANASEAIEDPSIREGNEPTVNSSAAEARALAPQDASVMSQALGWITAICAIADEAQEVLSTHLQVPNPEGIDEIADMEEEDPMMGSASAGRSLDLSLARAKARRI